MRERKTTRIGRYLVAARSLRVILGNAEDLAHQVTMARELDSTSDLVLSAKALLRIIGEGTVDYDNAQKALPIVQ